MNRRFRDAVTSSAFNLSLSGRQIEYLLCFAANVSVMHFPTSVGAFWQLERKGLIWAKDRRGRICHDPPIKTKGLTKAGELVVAMLIEAGFRAEIEAKSSPLRGEKKLISKAVTVRRVA